MPTILLTRATKRSVSVVVRDGDATTHRLTLSPNNPTSRAAVCRAVRCDDQTLLAWIDALERSPHDPRRFEVTTGLGTTAPRQLLVREFDGTEVETASQADLVAVLARTPVDRLVTWADTDALCCLDIDYHGSTRPPRREQVEAWAERMAPTPLVWHLSRGGGVHAFFVAQPPFTAKMLAAAAALRWAVIDPTAGVELKTQVRGAGSERLVVAPGGQDTLGVLSSWLGRDTVEADDVADWLAANDMQQGHRYPHDRCPIDPTTTSDRDPVTVGEKGVYCHRCAGKGLSLGSRAPGFAPWAALCGAPSSGEVGGMVRNMAHWGHARLVLTHRYGLPEALARPAYEAALLATHLGRREACVPFAFHEDTMDLVRCNDSWVSVASGVTYGSKIDAMLAVLPQCLKPSDDGKLRPSMSTVSYLSQPVDLTDRGYKNVEVIHGFSFAKTFLPPPPCTRVPVPHRVLRDKGPLWHPRYRPRAGRMSVEKAWSILEQIFPRINRDLIRALLCAIGSAQETKLGLQPIVFIAGTSASSKTMSSLVAASIAGGEAPAVTYSNDEARFRQAVKDVAEKGCMIRADEFLKESKRVLRGAWSPKAAMEPLLTLTPKTLCHVLYLGPRPLGTLPVIVITETACPAVLKDYTQISRRVRYIPLHGSKRDWKECLAAAGLTGETMTRLRLVSAEVNEACDVILSDVVDEFFCTPMTWDAQADKCGIPTLEESKEFVNPVPSLLRFYQLVCQMPPQEDKHATRHKSKDGWRRISKHEAASPDAMELLDLFDGFSDEQGKNWGQSIILQEKSWGDLLKVDHYVNLDIHSEGGSVAYVRFRYGQPHALVKVNEQIRDPRTLEVPE